MSNHWVIYKKWSVLIMEYYSAIKRIELLAPTWRNLKNTIRCKGSKIKKNSIYCMIPFNWRSRKAKLNYHDRKQICGCLGLGVWGNWLQKSMKNAFKVIEMLIMLLVIWVHICESSSNGTLKTAVLIECKLYLKADF